MMCVGGMKTSPRKEQRTTNTVLNCQLCVCMCVLQLLAPDGQTSAVSATGDVRGRIGPHEMSTLNECNRCAPHMGTYNRSIYIKKSSGAVCALL